MEPAISNSRYASFVINLSIFSIGLSTTYSLACLNPLVPVIRKIYNETYHTRHQEDIPEDTWTLLLTLTMSMLVVGAFCGSLTFKFVLSHLTRKQIMVISHICNITGYATVAIGAGIWGSYEAFIVGRFISGISTGLGLSLIPLVANELCVSHRQQFYGGVLGTSFQLGSPIAVLIAWPEVLGTDELWIGVMLFGMVYSALYLVFAYWLTDTPLQILTREGEEKAMKILRKLRKGDGSEIKAEMHLLVKDVAKKGEASAIATFVEVMKISQYRKHFIGVVILFSFVMACGLNNILFYSNSIFLNAGLDDIVVTPATLGVLALGPIFSVIGIYIVNCGVEPKYLLIIGSLIAVVGDAFLTACLATSDTVPGMSIAAIAAVCIFYIGFTFINLICYMMSGAIAIDKTRPVCTNVGAASLWFFAWFVGFMSPYFEIWIGPYAFLVWMGFTIIILIYIIFFVPTIGGKTSDEIQEYYKDRKPTDFYEEKFTSVQTAL
uniref:solute carrier family 2, facilitated glucose transporter member 5-like n=1 Tax=Styela clava TaxID=7725 RepID=UPI00193A9301|nr:solute carrier family 2, facilitated glucose transporter member 5-like [Styela clava]